MKKTIGDDPIYGTLEKAGEVAIKDGGLTKREYFAINILQGLVSSRGGLYSSSEELSESVQMADRLIKQLNKEGG